MSSEAVTSNLTCCHNFSDIISSPKLAIGAVAVGVILITLGIVLRAYAGLSPIGSYCLIGAGLFVWTAACTQLVLFCIRKCSQPRTIGEAIYRGDLNAVEGFHGDVNSPDSSGTLPLTAALEQEPKGPGVDPFVRYLVENGADVNAVDKNGWSPLHTAILFKQSLETITFLLDKGANVNPVSPKRNDLSDATPMVLAIESKRTEVVQLLIDRGADMSWVDKDQNNYLLWAFCVAAPEEVWLALMNLSR
jgi:hypothetical protein